MLLFFVLVFKLTISIPSQRILDRPHFYFLDECIEFLKLSLNIYNVHLFILYNVGNVTKHVSDYYHFIYPNLFH